MARSTEFYTLIKHFYFGKGKYYDISKWCDDYLNDEGVKRLLKEIDQEVSSKNKSLVGTLKEGEKKISVLME